MKWAEIVLEYVRTLIWPAIVLIAVLVIRPHLGDFFKRMRVGEFNGFGLKVRAELDEVMQYVASQVPSTTTNIDGQGKKIREKFDGLIKALDPPAKSSPDPALEVQYATTGLTRIVIECGSLFGLEANLEEMTRIMGEGKISGPVPVGLEKLKKAGIIEKDLSAALTSLAVLGHVLTSDVLHLKDGDKPGFKNIVDAETARSYRNAVVETSKILIGLVIEAYLERENSK